MEGQKALEPQEFFVELPEDPIQPPAALLLQNGRANVSGRHSLS